MSDLFTLSSRFIDAGIADEPTNRVSNQLSELVDNLAIVESFSHVVVWRSDEGLVCFDTSSANTAPMIIKEISRWSIDPLHSLVYTHGHIDHVGGSATFAAHSKSKGQPVPQVIGHTNVAQRFDRYRYTNDWNVAINRRQFGGVRADHGLGIVSREKLATGIEHFLPEDCLQPDIHVSDYSEMTFGDTKVEFHHARGETDDHLWAWIPEKKWVFTGDFMCWNFPNAGNPQKVQRYPIEWAAALRAIAARQPEVLLPAHGLPIEGAGRIQKVLTEVADVLEQLVRDVIEMMNNGERLNTILHTVHVPADQLAKPYLRPMYDEPEFLIRNIWRQFGGWWDGYASHLKPARDEDLAIELATIAGGAHVLITRALEHARNGELRLACHLADFAGDAAPDDPEIHEGRAHIYELRRKSELSLMAKGIYKAASRESEIVVDRSNES
jgi:alkyl sulfatase BDS1-like metallo-beta-lactamase superfamily hydrolase